MMRHMFYLCATTFGQVKIYIIFSLSHCQHSDWYQTFDVRMIRQMFYQCATTIGQVKIEHFFSLPLRAAATGLEPLKIKLGLMVIIFYHFVTTIGQVKIEHFFSLPSPVTGLEPSMLE